MQMSFLLLTLTCVSLVAQQSVVPVAFSESKDTIPAFAASGAITLPAVHLHLDISYPRGKKQRGDLAVIYDPQNGHYLWRYTAFDSPDESRTFLSSFKSGREVAYADLGGLADFVFPYSLFVKMYTGHADSLDAAERAAINEIREGLAIFEGGYHRDYKGVGIWQDIPDTFRCLPFHANCQDDMNRIVSISKQAGNWRLVLRNRWDQEIILDPNFKLMSTKQLTQPPKE